jgi:bifunctional DNase/RNase
VVIAFRIFRLNCLLKPFFYRILGDNFTILALSHTMKLIQLNIQGISYSETQTGAYALILSEVDGNRRLPIIIGGFEAQSIAIALEKEIKPKRPLTHDLFKNFAERFNVYIKQVIIHKLVDGVFYSSLICERDKIEEIIDARTSDAIAMALRFGAPIFIYDSILKQAGFDESTIKDDQKNKGSEDWIQNFVEEQSKQKAVPDDLKKLSLAKLKSLLDKLVNLEDYEKAVKIRDEISKRESKK